MPDLYSQKFHCKLIHKQYCLAFVCDSKKYLSTGSILTEDGNRFQKIVAQTDNGAEKKLFQNSVG
jgi:hypothetical protein